MTENINNNLSQTENKDVNVSVKISWKDKLDSGWKELLSYFNLKDDLVSQEQAEEEIRSGVSFKGSQLVILILAIFVASLGLNTNSIPVIIGAMLISPLMGPIIGIGLGLGIEDFTLVKRGGRNILMAVLGSLLASAVYFLISPQNGDSSQLLARTSPSIYDVFIALFGGGAGIVSIGCKNKGQVMPGVAIATSLMPPLCTAGYGLATLQAHFFFGALYLFFTNMMFILVAAWIGVRLFGYHRIVYTNTRRASKVRFAVYCLIGATVIVSIYLTVVMIRQNIFVNAANNFVEKEMIFPNTQVFTHREYISGGKRYIDVNLIGATLPKDSLQLAMMRKLNDAGLGGTILNIRQGFGITEGKNVNSGESVGEMYPMFMAELQRRQETIDSLRQVTLGSRIFSSGQKLSGEIKALFPSVGNIAIASGGAANTATGASMDSLNIVFISAPRGLAESERTRLLDFLKIRLEKNDLHIVVNPQSFPWPRWESASDVVKE